MTCRSIEVNFSTTPLPPTGASTRPGVTTSRSTGPVGVCWFVTVANVDGKATPSRTGDDSATPMFACANAGGAVRSATAELRPVMRAPRGTIPAGTSAGSRRVTTRGRIG